MNADTRNRFFIFAIVAVLIICLTISWTSSRDLRNFATSNEYLSSEISRLRIASYYVEKYNSDYRKRLADAARQLTDLQSENMELQRRLGDSDKT